MDNDNGNLPGLIRIRKYFGKSLRFYNLKAELLTPAVFVITLLLAAIPIFLPDELVSDIVFYIAYELGSIIAVFLVSSVYLSACISEFSGRPYTAQDCIKSVLRSVPVLLGAYILVTLGNLIGLFLLVIPGIVFYIMSMFFSCFILDAGKGVIDSIRSSWRVTAGRKLVIFSIVFAINLFLSLPSALIIMIAVPQYNMVIYTFVTSFMLSLINLVQLRLTALLYLDLTKVSDAGANLNSGAPEQRGT